MKELTEKQLRHIHHQVPVDYYQRGVKKNILQRAWHIGKLNIVYRHILATNTHPKNILDVGCASGWFLSELAKKFSGTSYYGIDTYNDAIMHGKKLYKNLKLIHADGHNIPFHNGFFDVVICNEVLEHVMNPEKVLQEIKRVLNPKGHAIIEMDTGNILFRFAWFWWTHVRHGVWENAHIQVFNTEKLEKLIKKNGFLIKSKNIFNASMAVVFVLTKK